MTVELDKVDIINLLKGIGFEDNNFSSYNLTDLYDLYLKYKNE